MKLAKLKPEPVASDMGATAGKTRREQAIDAAAKVFAQFGYHGAGTRAIADLLGIKVASLYFHFRSKDEALEEVCRVGLDNNLVRLKAACEAETGFHRRIEHFLADYCAYVSEQRDYLAVFQNERRYLGPEATARLNAASRQSALAIEQIFIDAQSEGAMDPAIPLRMARLILIGMLRNITQFQLEGSIADFETFVRRSGEHFLRGLAPQPG
jgi:AcrR family transcriptional regulator